MSTRCNTQNELLLQNLMRFYENKDSLKRMVSIINGESKISLRIVDWFVTNYAKQHNISYILNSQEFLVYTNYKSQLKAYSKKLFDPFCRRERIMFQIPGQPLFQTTVGKLNFFRWALEKGVLDYIKMNMVKIEAAMNTSSRELQKMRKAISSTSIETSATTRSSTRKRLAVTTPPNSKLMQKHEYSVQVTFD